MNYKEILKKIEESLDGQAHLDELTKKKQDPFKILVSTILSARTRDSNTRIATERLFKKHYTPKLIAEEDNEVIEELIRPSGFYKVKAARVKEVSKIILEKYNSQVPHEFDKLIDLPGVGAKTANCVLVYAFKIPAIPVDTHVHRISNRLGWLKTKTPGKTEERLKEIIPRVLWIDLNRLLVRFGQEICLPNHPRCKICPINDLCPKDFTLENEIKKKRNNKEK
jgi:endonuclease-3